jgi:hypothetical protein
MEKNFRKENGYILLGDIANFLKTASCLNVYGKFVKGEFGTKEFRFKDIFGDIINKLFMEA